MTSTPLIRALVISALGTSVLWLLGQFLGGLVGSPADLVSAAATAFAATLLFARRPTVTFGDSLRPATFVVFTTLFGIAAAHGMEQVFSRHQTLDFEPLGKFLWAVIATSWWLIPATAGVLSLLGRAANDMIPGA